ncbi:MAG: peptidoglycan-associated lipoprotein Pal [Vicinamibacterales bacterium]
MVPRGMARFAVRGGALLLMWTIAACGHKTPPVARPTPPAPPSAMAAAGNGGNSESGANNGTRPPAPPAPMPEAVIVPPEPVTSDAIASASLDELNRTSPLKPVFFDLDSAEVSPAAQAVLDGNAAVLRRYGVWTVTIEGHCDERGTAEYNLALGERRALAARAYLVSLGLAADRLRTVSYGKEFPFDPGHEEAAFSKNRRAHFVITAK